MSWPLKIAAKNVYTVKTPFLTDKDILPFYAIIDYLS